MFLEETGGEGGLRKENNHAIVLHAVSQRVQSEELRAGQPNKNTTLNPSVALVMALLGMC